MKNHRPSFVRFLELTPSHMNCDLHVHTNRTDGEADIQSILRTAAERGLKRIAFTEHVHRESDWFGDFANEVHNLASTYTDMEVYVGCETKALNTRGDLDVSEEILAGCDLLLGSVHRFPNGNGGFLDMTKLSREEFAETEFELALGLLESAHLDVLAHPGGMYFRQYNSDFPPDLMRQLIEASLERGVAIEINSSYLRNPLEFLTLCAGINPYVSIGSDVHRLEHLGKCRDMLMRERKYE